MMTSQRDHSHSVTLWPVAVLVGVEEGAFPVPNYFPEGIGLQTDYELLMNSHC